VPGQLAGIPPGVTTPDERRGRPGIRSSTNLPPFHLFGAVKEQVSTLYAEKLTEQSYITLVYDASYQGESGGEPVPLE
jgi:hypothetical protein